MSVNDPVNGSPRYVSAGPRSWPVPPALVNGSHPFTCWAVAVNGKGGGNVTPPDPCRGSIWRSHLPVAPPPDPFWGGGVPAPRRRARSAALLALIRLGGRVDALGAAVCRAATVEDRSGRRRLRRIVPLGCDGLVWGKSFAMQRQFTKNESRFAR